MTSPSGPSHPEQPLNHPDSAPFSHGMVHHRLDEAESLEERVRRSLLATGRSQFSRIHVSVANGEVTLAGNLPSYFMKQLAQHTAMSVAGVRKVHSRLTVR